jgi:hypothetical protein
MMVIHALVLVRDKVRPPLVEIMLVDAFADVHFDCKQLSSSRDRLFAMFEHTSPCESNIITSSDEYIFDRAPTYWQNGLSHRATHKSAEAGKFYTEHIYTWKPCLVLGI